MQISLLMHLLTTLSLILKDTVDVATHASDSHESTSNGSASNSVQCPSSIEEKALIKKIDVRVIPILFLIYLAAFLDRWVTTIHGIYASIKYSSA